MRDDAPLAFFREILESDRMEKDALLAPGRRCPDRAFDPWGGIAALDPDRMMAGNGERSGQALHPRSLIGPDIGKEPFTIFGRHRVERREITAGAAHHPRTDIGRRTPFPF